MKTLPERLWQKSQWQATTSAGSPSTVSSSRPQAHVAVAPKLTLGGTYVDDHDPTRPFELRGDPKIIAALGALLQAFVTERRMRL